LIAPRRPTVSAPATLSSSGFVREGAIRSLSRLLALKSRHCEGRSDARNDECIKT
jgi:hypothetical protein